MGSGEVFQEEALERRGKRRPLSVAPMMDCTDRHFRFFIRLLTRHSLLYTEMITAPAILRGDRERYLAFDPAEHPLAIQLGGDDPAQLAECAQIAEERGYDEVNLNVGCPSDRVQGGNFGVCLMKQPRVVADVVNAMRARVSIPVTVKHRIGVDDLDRYEDMARFVDVVRHSGCDRFVVHARKAWLKGLSPKENRTKPPLRYEDVHRLKQEFPALRIEINGGIMDIDQAVEQLEKVDGVMIGRAAYDTPYMLAEADRRVFGDDAEQPSRRDVMEQMLPYIERWLATGLKLHHISRHLHGLFAGFPGARAFRRHLSENAHRPGAGAQTVRDAMSKVFRETTVS